MAIIYHVTSKEEWEKALEQGFYDTPSLQSEGFIHCSEKQQVAGVLERYFAGRTGLVQLEIDTDKLSSRYVVEWSPSVHDHFPHIYGRLNNEAVTGVKEI